MLFEEGGGDGGRSFRNLLMTIARAASSDYRRRMTFPGMRDLNSAQIV
jgi:hypothetical protein